MNEGTEEGFAYIGKQLMGDLLTSEGVSEFQRGRTERYGDSSVVSDLESDEEEEVGADGKPTLGAKARKLAAYALDMRSMASAWQITKMSQCYTELQRGFFPGVSPDRADVVPERVFRCEKTFVLDNWNPEGELFTALQQSRVIAHVMAKTGFGKSTKLATTIAAVNKCRVLQICPDACLKAELAERKVPGVVMTNQWLHDRTAAVTYMTPLEFCARFFGEGWKQLFDRFEVIILDEAHVPKGQWYAVRAAFASKDTGTTSFLMLTATIPGKEDLQVTKYKPGYLAKPIEDFVSSSGFMQSAYAKDRLMIIVETDERLNKVANILLEHGCEVYTLTKGASKAAVHDVAAKFQRDSPSIRVLVAHERFGTGYNFSVSRVVSTGLRSVISKTSEGYAYKSVPLTESEVKQHMGRAGRGITDMLGVGLVLLNESQVAPDVDLIESEKFYTYVLLTAMGIQPSLRIRLAVTDALPDGLARRVAVSLLNVIGLPVEVSVRFLGTDGRFPSQYGDMLRNFSTRSANHLVSAQRHPYRFEDWVSVKAFGMFKSEEGPLVRVPFKCAGELMTILVLVCAAAEGIYTASSTPQNEKDCSGYDSGPEGEALAGSFKRYSYGYVTPVQDLVPPRPVVHPVREVSRDNYKYNIPVSSQAQYTRRHAFIASTSFIDELALKSEPVVEYVVEDGGTTSVKVSLPIAPGTTTASSPGGTPVAHMPREMWKALMDGEVLPFKYVDILLLILSKDCEAFCYSTTFSNWNNAWLSVLRTFCAQDIILYVRDKGGIHIIIAMFSWLWGRYERGMVHATKVSHVYHSYWRKLIKDDKGYLMHLKPGQRVDVAQSEDFKQRLFDIRLNFAYMLVAFEAAGMYNEYAISELQRVLPISQRLGNRLFDAVDSRRAAKPYLSIEPDRSKLPVVVQFKNKK